MKWLLLFPAWVILASYVIHRVKDANRQPDGPAAIGVAEERAIAQHVRPPEPEPERRPPEVDGAEMARWGADFRGRVSLVPPPQSGGGADHGASPLWPLTGLGPTAAELAATAHFDRWTTFHDREVSFMVPAAPGFRVEPVSGGERFPMVADFYHGSDRTPDRWLRIVGPGEVTFCALAIDRAPNFDSRERFPDPEVFHKLLLAGGGAARVSCGADGVPRRVQWLGEEVRVSLLDWQHCVAHLDAYTSFAAGVQLVEELPEGRAALGKMVGAAGLETRLGLLERGMGEASVEALLGRPVGVATGTWVYHVPARGGDRYYRVPFVGGEFIGFRHDWRKVRRDPPVKGSLAWMREKTSFAEGLAGGSGYDLGVVTDGDVKEIFAAVRAELPTAGVDSWGEYCEVLSNMTEMGLRDDGVLEVLQSRFLEPALRPCEASIKVLRKWGGRDSRSLFARKGAAILDEEPWQSGGADRVAKVVRGLDLLIGAVAADRRAAAALVARAATHPVIAVRELGFEHWRLIAEDERRPLLRAGLDDDSVWVRRRCANALAAGCARPIDRTMLESVLAKEDDGATREHLSRALQALAASEPAVGSGELPE